MKEKNKNNTTDGPTSFVFDYVHLDPKEQIGLHHQSTWELSYIIYGTGIRLIGDTSEPFDSGEVILIPPGIPHCWYFDGNVTDHRGRIANITVKFDTALLNRCAHCFAELAMPIERLKSTDAAIKYDQQTADSLSDILKRMRVQSDAEKAVSFLRLLLMMSDSAKQTVVGQQRQPDKEKERLRQIEIYVTCNAKRSITLDDMARHIGMNRASFCVFFKKATNKTFITYLNEHRIDLACQLLAEQRLTISDVCYASGFDNIPYFNRVFKRLKGVSPGTFRKAHSGEDVSAQTH